MDFGVRREIANKTVLCVRLVGYYDVFTPKGAILRNRLAPSHYGKIRLFRCETINTSADSTVCTASKCYSLHRFLYKTGKIERFRAETKNGYCGSTFCTAQ